MVGSSFQRPFEEFQYRRGIDKTDYKAKTERQDAINQAPPKLQQVRHKRRLGCVHRGLIFWSRLYHRRTVIAGNPACFAWDLPARRSWEPSRLLGVRRLSARPYHTQNVPP